MCGRFTITLEARELQLNLSIGELPEDWQPRFNIAPSQLIPVVVDAGQRKVEWMQWGLVPFWAKSSGISSKLINARAETVAEKTAFRQSFLQRRCLILADGFFEWLKTGGRSIPSTPYFFHEKNKAPFTFSGLWDRWEGTDGKVLKSCTIITCNANEVVKPIHHRMPVILDEANRWEWLSSNEPQELQSLLVPIREDFLNTYPVSRLVNNPNIDSEDCLLPAREQGRLF